MRAPYASVEVQIVHSAGVPGRIGSIGRYDCCHSVATVIPVVATSASCRRPVSAGGMRGIVQKAWLRTTGQRSGSSQVIRGSLSHATLRRGDGDSPSQRTESAIV